MADGIIIKGIGGFYYVKTADGVLECKAKGIFRRRGVTPLAGDRVRVEGEEGGYVVSEIRERRNFFARPPIANVSAALLVVSTVDPKPSTLVIDRMTAACERVGVEPVVVFTKTDLAPADELIKIYRSAGFKVVDTHSDRALDELRAVASGGIAVVIGNSGAGKSTLLNGISGGLELKTGETSKKLGRGRHTTRAVELYEFAGGFLADTPGFASFETLRHASEPDEVAGWFRDIARHAEGCRFADCSHTVEKGCSVLRALDAGEIEPSRHKSYCEIYDEIKKGYQSRYD